MLLASWTFDTVLKGFRSFNANKNEIHSILTARDTNIQDRIGQFCTVCILCTKLPNQKSAHSFRAQLLCTMLILYTVKSVYSFYDQLQCMVTIHGHNAQRQCTITLYSHNVRIQCTVKMHNSYSFFSFMHALIFCTVKVHSPLSLLS